MVNQKIYLIESGKVEVALQVQKWNMHKPLNVKCDILLRFWHINKVPQITKIIEVSMTVTFKENVITINFISLQVSSNNPAGCHHCAFNLISPSSFH